MPAAPILDGEKPRRSKREMLLAAAAKAFNRSGVTQTSLAQIGQDLGVTRAALYYYAEDRDDLLFQCYRQACETQARDLERAVRGAGSALDRVLAYVRFSFDPERAEVAALCEVALLPDEKRETIEGLRQANLARLMALIEEGGVAREIRPCKPLIVAEAIAGMLAWGPIAPRWSDSAASPNLARLSAGACELLADGVAVDPARASDPIVVDLERLRAPTPAPFDRQAMAAQKTEEVLRTASRLFNERGVDATSLDDIAAALGATKGAVLHYFDDKPALVARCYARAFDLAEAVFEISRSHNGDGLARSLIGYRGLVEINARAGFEPLAPFVGLDALRPEDRAEVRRRITHLENIYPDDATRGVADGSIRDIDLQAVAVASAGTFGWLPKWMDGQKKHDASAIAVELQTLFAAGLRAR